MKLSTKYQARGLFHQAKGTVKEFAGRIGSNSTLRFKGTFERFAGKTQCNIGKAQGFFGL